jgi:hypothetical protein
MQKTCKDKVNNAFKSRIEDIKKLHEVGIGEEVEDIGKLENYGLCIDKVEVETFDGQREDYICYQLSYGGPTEEFRIYKNGDVEFWFLDWFDGAKVDVVGDDAEIIKDIVSCSGLEF